MDTNRRGFIGALGALLAMPAIVKMSSLMPISPVRVPMSMVDPYALGATPLTLTSRMSHGRNLLYTNEIVLKFTDGQVVSFVEDRQKKLWVRGELNDSRRDGFADCERITAQAAPHLGEGTVILAAGNDPRDIYLHPKILRTASELPGRSPGSWMWKPPV